jgi:hypothetical protein
MSVPYIPHHAGYSQFTAINNSYTIASSPPRFDQPKQRHIESICFLPNDANNLLADLNNPGLNEPSNTATHSTSNLPNLMLNTHSSINSTRSDLIQTPQHATAIHRTHTASTSHNSTNSPSASPLRGEFCSSPTPGDGSNLSKKRFRRVKSPKQTENSEEEIFQFDEDNDNNSANTTEETNTANSSGKHSISIGIAAAHDRRISLSMQSQLIINRSMFTQLRAYSPFQTADEEEQSIVANSSGNINVNSAGGSLSSSFIDNSVLEKMAQSAPTLHSNALLMGHNPANNNSNNANNQPHHLQTKSLFNQTLNALNRSNNLNLPTTQRSSMVSMNNTGTGIKASSRANYHSINNNNIATTKSPHNPNGFDIPTNNSSNNYFSLNPNRSISTPNNSMTSSISSSSSSSRRQVSVLRGLPQPHVGLLSQPQLLNTEDNYTEQLANLAINSPVSPSSHNNSSSRSELAHHPATTVVFHANNAVQTMPPTNPARLQQVTQRPTGSIVKPEGALFDLELEDEN